jgi:hypothetical protein
MFPVAEILRMSRGLKSPYRFFFQRNSFIEVAFVAVCED